MGAEMELPQKTPLKCNICGKFFTVKSNLTRHSKTHSGIPEFQCSICNRSSNLKQQLDRHKKIHLYPDIPLYNSNEVKLQCSDETKMLQNNQQRRLWTMSGKTQTLQKQRPNVKVGEL